MQLMQFNKVETLPTYIIHSDHLTGTNVVTDTNGDVVEVADYYPYGTERISSGSFEEQRKFAGTEYDSGTALNYMGARYYAGGKARFLSEDPVFLAVGSPELKQKTGLELQKYLENPQNLNSYSYTINNPLKHVDKSGEWYVEIALSGTYKVIGASAGIRIDGRGIDWFVSGGPSLGLMGSVEAAFSSGNLSHQPEISVSRSAKFAGFAGMGVEREGTYDYAKPFSPGNNQETAYSVLAGLGGSISQEYTLSTPLITWGSQSQLGNVSDHKHSQNNLLVTKTNYSNNTQPSSINQQSVGSSYGQIVSALSNVVSSLSAYVASLSSNKKR
jgi:RHS repeat-associated protein